MFINNHKKQIRLLCRILFVLYIAGLVYFLFFAEMLDRTGIERSYHYNLIPFRESGSDFQFVWEYCYFYAIWFSGPDPGQKKKEILVHSTGEF